MARSMSFLAAARAASSFPLIRSRAIIVALLLFTATAAVSPCPAFPGLHVIAADAAALRRVGLSRMCAADVAPWHNATQSDTVRWASGASSPSVGEAVRQPGSPAVPAAATPQRPALGSRLASGFRLMKLRRQSRRGAGTPTSPVEEVPYLEGPVWQDLRLLTSFALGIAFVHVMETLRDGCDGDGGEPGVPRAKFEMYPYAL
mmetsp:Transcript_109550/g.316738  ORF Transcript_109550/g.316738 Transcript_109550/m.316738 type:complete len:203 (+) Transcript_109550:116-724(+)